MKIKSILTGCLLLITSAVNADGISAVNMGIGEDAVFGVPTPSAFDYPTTKAGKSDLIPKAYHTAPPTVPHTMNKYLPINAEENQCMDCHDRKKLIGRTYKKGKKLPMPESHYGGFSGNEDKDTVSGARYFCNQCHVPASGATPLVENTFR